MNPPNQSNLNPQEKIDLNNLTPEQAQAIEEKQFINAVSIQGVMAVGSYKGVIHLKEKVKELEERLNRLEKVTTAFMASTLKENGVDIESMVKRAAENAQNAPESKETKSSSQDTQAHLNESGVNPG